MRGQLYHGHYLIISPLHGHGEVANENPLILPRILSIVGALALLKRRAGKKKCELRFQACLNLYIISSYADNKKLCISTPTVSKTALKEKDALLVVFIT